MSEQNSSESAGELINRAVVAARQRNLVQAIELFGRVIASDEVPAQLVGKAQLNRGVIYSALNLPEKALIDLDAALANPQLIEAECLKAHIERALVMSKLGRYDVAIVALLDLMPTLQVDSKPFQAGMQTLTRIRRERESRDPTFRRIAGQIKSSVIPNSVRTQARFDRALLLAEHGDWAGALDEYDGILTLPNISGALKAMTYCNRGVVRATKGRLLDASKDYHEALSIQDGGSQAHANANNNMGLLLLKDGQIEASIEFFSRGLNVPLLPNAVLHLLLFNRATAFGKMGRLEEQLQDLNALLDQQDLAPQWREKASNQRGLLLLKLGDFSGAEADLLWVVNDANRNEEQLAQAYNSLGVMAVKLNQTEQALHHFSQAVEMKRATGGTLSNAYFNLGAALGQIGQMNEALQAYTAAIEQVDGDGHAVDMAFNNRAMLFLDLGQDRQAWTDLVSLLHRENVAPLQQAKAYACQARIAYKAGQWDEVLISVQKGLQITESAALRLMQVLAHLWKGEGQLARSGIYEVKKMPEASQILTDFVRDLQQANQEGLPSEAVELIEDLLPTP